MDTAGDFSRRVEAWNHFAGSVQNLRFGIDPQTAHRMMNRRRIGSRIVWRIIQPRAPGSPAEFILLRIDRFAVIFDRLFQIIGWNAHVFSEFFNCIAFE